jgi:hypothetical protein
MVEKKKTTEAKATPNLRIAGWILGFIATNDEAPYREPE